VKVIEAHARELAQIETIKKGKSIDISRARASVENAVPMASTVDTLIPVRLATASLMTSAP
jgi:hypothetical protein